MNNIAENALPIELKHVFEAAKHAISPIKPLDDKMVDQGYSQWWGKRTQASQSLPPYYLVYFLLVELLGFRDLGQGEKVAWSVPIDFQDQPYVIEHRKFGLGLFVDDPVSKEQPATQIVALIKRGIKIAEPYYEWRAKKAMQTSEVNVTNNGPWLFSRYEYLRDLYRDKSAEAESRRDEWYAATSYDGTGSTTTTTRPYYKLKNKAAWLALAAIDAFFSWTEQVFIHLAILHGRISTGQQVADLASEDWDVKFKQALDLTEPGMKGTYDDLIEIRRQLRNFMAHGAFGKQGEAFTFHSPVGTIPVRLIRSQAKFLYSITNTSPAFNDDAAIQTIDRFITSHLWSNGRETARTYIQEEGLPLILTMSANGTYTAAMQSPDDMAEFVTFLTRIMDDAANMDL